MSFKIILCLVVAMFTASFIFSIQNYSINNYKGDWSLCECSKYLEKHVKILQEFNDKNKILKLVKFNDKKLLSVFLDKFKYEHKLMKICVDTMQKYLALEPLFNTWNFAQKMHIDKNDISFMKEYSILIFYLYEHLILVLAPNKQHKEVVKDVLEEILDLYNTVVDLPIKELIIGLEKCFVVFSKILTDNGIYSNLSWKQWVKQYWWVAPTICLAVLGVLLRRKSVKPFFQSNALKPTVNPTKLFRDTSIAMQG